MNKEKERKFWASYGKIYPYIERSTPYQQLLSDIRAQIAPKEGEWWLDAGCGPGTVMQVILQESTGLLEKLVGIDFDETMLTHAKQKMSETKRIELLQVDLSRKTPFESEAFDGIVANLVLTYISEFEGKQGREALEAVLMEMHRILKPGGRFVWTTPVQNVNFWKVFWASKADVLKKGQRENLFYGPAIMRYAQAIANKGKRGEYNFFENSTYENLMEKVGFENVVSSRSFAKQAVLISGNKRSN